MNAGGGSLTVGGNWTDNGTFTANGRPVTLNGAATQTVTRTGGETMASLTIDKTAGNVVLGSNLTLTGTSGDVLGIINAGNLDIAANTLTLSGSGGNWLSGGTAAGNRSVLGTTGTVALGGAKTFTNNNTKTLSFGSTLTLSIEIGRASCRERVTVNGTLQVNNEGTGVTNAPIYGSAAGLVYAGTVPVGNEWLASGTGGTG